MHKLSSTCITNLFSRTDAFIRESSLSDSRKFMRRSHIHVSLPPLSLHEILLINRIWVQRRDYASEENRYLEDLIRVRSCVSLFHPVPIEFTRFSICPLLTPAMQFTMVMNKVFAIF